MTDFCGAGEWTRRAGADSHVNRKDRIAPPFFLFPTTAAGHNRSDFEDEEKSYFAGSIYFGKLKQSCFPEFQSHLNPGHFLLPLLSLKPPLVQWQWQKIPLCGISILRFRIFLELSWHKLGCPAFLPPPSVLIVVLPFSTQPLFRCCLI